MSAVFFNEEKKIFKVAYTEVSSGEIKLDKTKTSG